MSNRIHPNNTPKRHFPKSAIVLLLALLPAYQQCTSTQNEQSSNPEAEVRKEIESLYEVYTRSDLAWIEFYSDQYTVAAGDGATYVRYADSLRAEWTDLYKKYEVILHDRGEPVLEASGDLVFHYNSFDESLINRETRDTIRNIGTWVALWQKNEDNGWQITFETYHAQPMEAW